MYSSAPCFGRLKSGTLGVIRSKQFLVDICQCLLEQLVIFTEQIKVRAVRHHLASNLASEEEVLTEGCLETACGVAACASPTPFGMKVATIHPQGQVFIKTLGLVQPRVIQLRKDTHL